MRREGGVRRNAAEEPLHCRSDLSLVNVTNDCQHRIIWRVPGGKEVAHIFKARCVQILHGSDRWVVIRMALWVCEGKEFKVCRPIRLVVIAGTLLVLHHIALVIKVCLIECLKKRSEAVRLHPEDQLHPLGRNGGEVVGAIEPGGGIRTPANRLNQRKMLSLRNVRRTLEHQVLKEMRKSSPTHAFIFGSNVIPEVDGGGWRSAIKDGDKA